MQVLVRQVHAAVAWLLVAAIVVQVWLAGMAIPQLGGGNGNFATHVDFGYFIGLIVLALLVTALPAGLGRRRMLQAAGIVGLYIVQTILPNVGVAVIEALHPVNAVLLFVASVLYARAVWRERATVPTAV
jgi:hypothetical protein